MNGMMNNYKQDLTGLVPVPTQVDQVLDRASPSPNIGLVFL